MVFPVIDDDARRKSMERCPRYKDCVSPLCPLDPYLKYNDRPPGGALCYWYDLMAEPENFVDMPRCVIDKLPDYIVHLIKIGALPHLGGNLPR